jgi:hypothetical protein
MADYKVKFLFADAVTIEQEFPGGVVVRDAKSTLIANWPAGVTRPNSPTPPDAPVPARHSILLRPACSLDACSDAAAAPAASSPHVFSFVVIRLPRINSQPRYRWMKEQERLNRSGRCQSLLLLLLLHSPPSSASSQLSTLRAVDCRTCACRVPAWSQQGVLPSESVDNK